MFKKDFVPYKNMSLINNEHKVFFYLSKTDNDEIELFYYGLNTITLEYEQKKLITFGNLGPLENTPLADTEKEIYDYKIHSFKDMVYCDKTKKLYIATLLPSGQIFITPISLSGHLENSLCFTIFEEEQQIINIDIIVKNHLLIISSIVSEKGNTISREKEYELK
jgi:hypothetical protein